jgi:hypothetical protein
MHLIKDTSKDGINTKCGRTVAKADATAWWRDVTCPDCNPFEWVPAEPAGQRMVRKADAPPEPRRRVVPRQWTCSHCQGLSTSPSQCTTCGSLTASMVP